MDQQALLSASYLDIVFDHRNKAYGGYELRKNYEKRMTASLGLIILAASAFSAYFLLAPAPVTPMVVPDKFKPIDMTGVVLDYHPPAPAPSVAKAENAAIRIVKDNDVKPELPKPEVPNPEAPTTLPAAGTGGGPGTHVGVEGTDRSKIPGPEPIPMPAKAEKPLTYADIMPEYNGKLEDYLNSHLRYPATARDGGIEGRVTVRFVVNEDGSIDNAGIIQGIGGGCNEEALRVVRSMPKWKAGRQNGKAVKVYFTLPIVFRLE